MGFNFMNVHRGMLTTLLLLVGIFTLNSCSSDPDVTLREDANTYILDNGIVTARVAKASGDLVSLRYLGKEMLATFLTPEGEPDLEKDPPGANPNGLNRGMTDHQYGFWSHDAMGPRGTGDAIPTITINPKKNGGKMAEVSVKGISKGRKMGTGPGSKQDGQFESDIEIRYTLERGASGVYTYCIFEHTPEYGLTALGEARFCAKLADFFDWMSISENRDFYYPKEYNAGDKYVYTQVQSENPAFGWSSTTEKVGLFIINPSMEYMSGGPTKVEFLGHRDTNPVAAPCVLNYWRSSHYGGSDVSVGAGEDWKKVVGPFMIYVNTSQNPEEIYANAKAMAITEAAKWPYDWVEGVDYPKAEERATVKGQFVLNDPITQTPFSHLKVGLTHPAYHSPRAADVQPVVTDWQRDAKFYQFWTEGNADGTFAIPHVRPGRYTLHAFTDGVLGEYVQADVVVEGGKALDLGQLTWTPVRYGKQIWEIGIPNRNASEFFKAEEYNKPEISLDYALLFPDDIQYTIGQSDYKKDWFFQHVPHNEDPEAKVSPFFGARSPGRATPYTVIFNMPSAPTGKATLRLGICGSGTRKLEISVNGKPAGTLEGLTMDGVITRHGTHGLWNEQAFTFSANRLKVGANTLTITVPAGPVNDGIMYDYLRLEVDEQAR